MLSHAERSKRGLITFVLSVVGFYWMWSVVQSLRSLPVLSFSNLFISIGLIDPKGLASMSPRLSHFQNLKALSTVHWLWCWIAQMNVLHICFWHLLFFFQIKLHGSFERVFKMLRLHQHSIDFCNWWPKLKISIICKGPQWHFLYILF